MAADRWQKVIHKDGAEGTRKTKLYDRIQHTKATQIIQALTQKKHLSAALLQVSRKYPQELGDLRRFIEDGGAPVEGLKFLQDNKRKLVYQKALEEALGEKVKRVTLGRMPLQSFF